MEEEEEGEWADPPPMCVAAAMGIRGALEDEPRPSSRCAGGRGGRWLRFIRGRAHAPADTDTYLGHNHNNPATQEHFLK